MTETRKMVIACATAIEEMLPLLPPDDDKNLLWNESNMQEDTGGRRGYWGT